MLALLPILGTLLDKFFPNASDAADAKLKLMAMAQTGELAQLDADLKLATGQMEVNKVEAASSSLFVAGPRPFIMWICGVALGYAAILEPIGRFIDTVVYQYHGAFPVIDTTITMQLLLGLLGLGAMRSYDKKQGTAS
jgi:hypothetical protein